MSKLHVEICEIKKIENLENADKLVLATIKDWQCLIGKGQHTVGELVIFVPPDAVMPHNLIEELKLDYLKGYSRVKTVKLRGYISQGLVLPVCILDGLGIKFGRNYQLGYDCAKDLGITKYEVVKKSPGNSSPKYLWRKIKDVWKGVFIGKVPFCFAFKQTYILILNRIKGKGKVNLGFDIYTDIDNIKHYPTVFEDGEEVIITEKIHGTNFRAGNLPVNNNFLGKIKKIFTSKKYEFVYGSHRVQKTVLSGKGFYGEDVYGQIAERYKLEEIIPKDYIIYGEIYGPKIQELTYGATKREVVFFDVRYKGKYLDFQDFRNFCESRNLPIAPVCYIGPYSKEILDKYTNAKNTILKSENGYFVKQIREGCVVKPIIEEYSNRCGRKILKSISVEYLLTKKKENPEEVVDDSAKFPH